MNIKYFKYGKKEIDYLSNKDEIMKKTIEEIGFIKREVNNNIFQAVVQKIIGQQISTQVQLAIIKRLKEQFPLFNAEVLSKASFEQLRNLGLSSRKVTYIKEFSEKVYNGSFNLEQLKTMSDEDVIKTLTSLKGIGIWTAQMTLLFSLERTNVFSYGDLAIRKGLKILYGHDKITKEIFEYYRNLFSPYCSVASLYLWAANRIIR